QGCVRMADPDLDLLRTAIKRRWSWVPSPKAKGYVNAFSAAERRGTKISAKVVGNHGTYTVSIQVDEHGLRSACSCYIGKHGHCHHCEALALTFLDNPSAFKAVKSTQAQDVHDLLDVRAYIEPYSDTCRAWSSITKDYGCVKHHFLLSLAPGKPRFHMRKFGQHTKVTL